MKRFYLIPIMIILGASPCFGQFYEYKDKHGNIVITDSPPSGVESQKKNVQQEIYQSTQPETNNPPAEYKYPSNNVPVQEIKRKKDYSRVSVILYMTDWCGYCKKAREYIHSLGANLTEYNIEKDTNKREEMRQKTGNPRSVPVIDIEGTIIRGYNTGAIKAALDRNAR